VRNGSVVDLQIKPGTVAARVSGSSIYRTTITVKPVPKAKWQQICADCAGGIDSLVELLQGRFSKGVMDRLCRQGDGLFPVPMDIRFDCSCPDGAYMCKHVAPSSTALAASTASRSCCSPCARSIPPNCSARPAVACSPPLRLASAPWPATMSAPSSNGMDVSTAAAPAAIRRRRR
jgi:hypothetical protein